jgi:aldose 1-epimerase
MKIQKSLFGNLADGREVSLYTLTNDHKIKVQISCYGALITRIETPDKEGNTGNIVCGFDKLSHYLDPSYLSGYPYFGCIIGRFGNRIAGGNLLIEGKKYQLAVNNGPNHLHGGHEGFDKKRWEAEPFENSDAVGVKMSYLSPDGEENYPGNLKVTCIYTLNNRNELILEYLATTDQTTVVNLTNHTYFNLTCGRENILNHQLKLSATHMTEMKEQISTGKIVPVKGTPYDFTTYKTFSENLNQLPAGYDDNFVLDNEQGKLKYAGTLAEKTSGRKVDVFTTQPGMQLYTGYWIPELTIDNTKKFGRFSGVALETQHYPDSVNQPDFPSTLLKPGETYNEKTIYQFG